MKNSNRQIGRATIEDLSTAGTTLSDEQLQLASGGGVVIIILGTYRAASSTFCNDTDYRHD